MFRTKYRYERCMKSHSNLRTSQLKKKKREIRNVLGHSEWFTGSIIYYDNKRRCPLRKAGGRTARVHVTRTSCAVSVHLFIFIFLIPVTTLQRGGRTAGRTGRRGKRGSEKRYGRASVDSPCQRTTRFGAGKSLDSRGPAFVLPYFLLAPACLISFPQLDPVCRRKFIALTKLYSPRSLEIVARRTAILCDDDSVREDSPLDSSSF